MLRVACLLALLLFAPVAAAAPTVEATIGPGQGYYLKVTATQPEAPRGSAEPADDCASKSGAPRPATAEEGLARAAAPYLGGSVPLVDSGTTRPYIPGCVAAPAATCPVPGSVCAIVPGTYASYDFATGRYYVEVPLRTAAAPTGPASHGGIHLTGTTGASGEGDCEGCPPPFSIG